MTTVERVHHVAVTFARTKATRIKEEGRARMIGLRQYAIVTAAYWAFTLTDGALRLLVLLHFHELGYSPVQLAFLFLLYEFFGIVTNLVGGWLAARTGLRLTLVLGLGLQVVALVLLALLNREWTLGASVAYVMTCQSLSGIAKDLTKMSAKSARMALFAARDVWFVVSVPIRDPGLVTGAPPLPDSRPRAWPRSRQCAGLRVGHRHGDDPSWASPSVADGRGDAGRPRSLRCCLRPELGSALVHGAGLLGNRTRVAQRWLLPTEVPLVLGCPRHGEGGKTSRRRDRRLRRSRLR